MSLVTPMFSSRELHTAGHLAAITASWLKLDKARRRRDRPGTKLHSRHYLAVVDAERGVLDAVDAWQQTITKRIP